MSGTLVLPSTRAQPPAPAVVRTRDRAASLSPRTEPVVYYQGRRIYFRPLELEDESLLRRWINDPTVREYMLHRPPLNAAREKEWIESLGKSPLEYVFGVVISQEHRLIGTTGLHRLNPVSRSASLGVCIGDRTFQGRGYGREAIQLLLKFGFEELNLNRISLSVFADNWRAIRTYQKVGFCQEGCARQAFYRNGRYQDEYLFAMLRSEWSENADRVTSIEE